MIVWIASFPRSGNTLCRMILKDVFGLDSSSIYIEDNLDFIFKGESIPNNEAYAKGMHDIFAEDDNIHLIKTHGQPVDDSSAIYIVRDGREAIFSTALYWKCPLKYVILGENIYVANWSAHWYGWDPAKRPKTLVLRYEELLSDPDGQAIKIGNFLGRKPIKSFENQYQACVLNASDKKLFTRNGRNWANNIKGDKLRLFNKIHGKLMYELGYYEKGNADGQEEVDCKEEEVEIKIH